MNAAVVPLALSGARTSRGRLAGIVAGVAVGVTLLLLLLGASAGVGASDERSAWLREYGAPAVTYDETDGGASDAAPMLSEPLTAENLLIERRDEIFADSLIQRRDVAATPDSTVAIPGVAAIPKPGTYVASPALEALIESTPADQLGERFGTFTGTIDPRALAGPDSLVIVVGATERELTDGLQAAFVTGFTTNPYGDNAGVYRTVLAMGGLALLVPVLLLISITTALGGAQRAERCAALRLLGARRTTVAAVVAVETAATSLLGAVIGAATAFVVRPLAASVPVGPTRLESGDLSVSPLAALTVVLVTVIAATAVAAVRAYRDDLGPLGATRTRLEKAPTVRRVIPLIAGLVSMLGAVRIYSTSVPDTIALALLFGSFALIAIGLIVVGPWLTFVISRFGAQRASHPASVMAANRISRTPVSTFRAVSGVVLAVFLVSIFAGASSALSTGVPPPDRPGSLQSTSVWSAVGPDASPAAITDVQASLAATDGIPGSVVLRRPDNQDSGDYLTYIRTADASLLGLETSTEAPVVAFDHDKYLNVQAEAPAAAEGVSEADLRSWPVTTLIVPTDGSAAARDRARTALNTSGLTVGQAISPSDVTALTSTRLVRSLTVLANMGTGAAVAIAGLSLAVATASAVIDRKRALGLMRLMGMPLSTVRGLVLREAAVPLLSVLALAAGLGFLVAGQLVDGLGDGYVMTWPGLSYLVTLSLSLGLALLAVVATFGLLRTTTSAVSTRFE